MSHPEQLQFFQIVKSHFPDHFTGGRVLEIGSLDINGSIRKHFTGGEYVGVDVAEGPGVDHVGEGQLVDFKSESFDVCASAECLEHNPYWVETLSNMFRMTKPGGLVVMSCASTGRREHGTTRTSTHASPLTADLGWDYYGNVSPGMIEKTFQLEWWFSEYELRANYQSTDTYLIGLKKPDEKPEAFRKLRADLDKFCNPLQSFRSAMVFTSVKLGGETGAAVVRRAGRATGILKDK